MWANFQLNFTPIGNIIVLLTTLQSWSMRTSLLIHRLCIAVFHRNVLMTANFQLNFTSIWDLISFVNRSSQNWHLRASPFLCHFVDYTCISYRGGPIFSLTLHRFGNVIVFLIQHRETGIWGRLKSVIWSTTARIALFIWYATLVKERGGLCLMQSFVVPDCNDRNELNVI